MAGAKGRSGGARPGAGRKPGPKTPAVLPIPPLAAESAGPGEVVGTKERDMLQVLQDVALGKIEATALQVRAAIAAVQYTHTKTHDGGKKEQQQQQAAEVSQGRFKASKAPLRVVNGK